MAAVRINSGREWKQLLSSVDTILCDCDGVLWVGNTDPVPGAKEALAFIRNMGKKVCFITNNSSKSRAEHLKKIHQLGFEAYENEVYHSGYVAAYYLKHFAKYSGKVYLVGVSGTKCELESMGLTCIGTGPDPIEGTMNDWLKLQLDTDVGAVVVGYDCHISYMKLIRASSYLTNPDCLFIATNEDSKLPTPNHSIRIPGTGSIVSAVRVAAEREPIIVGKPWPPMFDCIAQSIGIDPARTLMIGDRLDTDILFGRQNKLKTLLVLTGIQCETDLSLCPENQIPDYYTDSIADILSIEEQ